MFYFNLDDYDSLTIVKEFRTNLVLCKTKFAIQDCFLPFEVYLAKLSIHLPYENVQDAEDTEDEEADGKQHFGHALRQVGLPAEEDPQRLHDDQESEQDEIGCQVASRIWKNWNTI